MSSVNVMKRFNVVETLEDKRTKCLALTWSIFYFLGCLGLLIPVGIFLFNIEDNVKCAAPQDWDSVNDFSKYVNVSYRFDVILILYFTILLVECVRYFCLILGILLKSKWLMLVWVILIPVDLLNFASMIVLHTWRFRTSG